jgi:hypothetical protein
MTQSDRHVISRRIALAGGAGALAAVSLARSSSAAPVVQSGGGISGGGSIATEGGEAQFSAFGSRFAIADADAPLIVAAFRFFDQAANTLVNSLEVSDYGPVAGSEETTRQMTGTATVNGGGVHPFMLVLVDGGGPGEEKDSIDLKVGEDGAESADQPLYQAAGTLETGDLQLVDLNLPI